MKKRMLKSMAGIAMCTLCICSALPHVYAEGLSSEAQLVRSQKMTVESENVEIGTYNDNGKEVVTYGGDVEDKFLVLESLSNEINSHNSMISVTSEHSSTGEKTSPDGGWAPVRHLYANGVASNNSSVGVYSYLQAQAWSVLTEKLNVWGGYTSGIFTGTGNPKKIVLRQGYSFTGMSLSISWPLSLGLSSSTTSYNWISSDYDNEWYVSADHEDITVSDKTAAISFTVTDGADMYIGSTCYKARCTIANSWHGIYYN